MSSRQISVNLPIQDLEATVDFFTKLGFQFNPRFTDEDATCMITDPEASQEYREAQDHRWMYARAYTDLEGHVWEVMHSDVSQLSEEMQGGA